MLRQRIGGDEAPVVAAPPVHGPPARSSALGVGAGRHPHLGLAEQAALGLLGQLLDLAAGLGVVVDLLQQQLGNRAIVRSEEHTSELQSLMRISYAVFCLKKKNK